MMAGLAFSVSVDTAVGCGYSCKLAYDFGCRIETPKTTSPAFFNLSDNWRRKKDQAKKLGLIKEKE